MRLTGKDVAATVFTALVVAVFIAFRQGSDLPLLGSVRGTAGVVLFLGWVGGCALSGVGHVYSPAARTSKALVAALTLFGVVALTAGVVAVVASSEVALAVLVTATVMLWLLSTVRHATTHPIVRSEPARQYPVGNRSVRY